MTISELAKKLNFSISTISRVLSNDPTIKVKEETQKLIIKEALKNNIKIKDKNDKNVLIITSYKKEVETTDPYYLNLRTALEIKLNNNSYKYETVEYSDSIKYAKTNIFLGSFKNEDIQKISVNKKHNIFCDSFPNASNIDCVSFDYKASVYMVLNYLVNNGHTKIAFIGGNDHSNDIDFREKYYRKFMNDKLTLNEEHIYINSFDSYTGYEGAKKIFSKDNIPTALFVANDSIAIGCYKALKEFSISIPNQVSIIGFNDSSFSEFLIPSLSSVKISCENIINETINLIEEKNNNGRIYPKKSY